MWYYYINSILKGGFLLKNREYRQRKQLAKLIELRERGVPEVRWNLTVNQFEYLAKYFELEPGLYAISTKPYFTVTPKSPSILKVIKAAKLERKHEIVRTLSAKQVELLDYLDIPYRYIKCRIILREN